MTRTTSSAWAPRTNSRTQAHLIVKVRETEGLLKGLAARLDENDELADEAAAHTASIPLPKQLRALQMYERHLESSWLLATGTRARGYAAEAGRDGSRDGARPTPSQHSYGGPLA